MSVEEKRGPGRPAAGTVRVQYRPDQDSARWLASRAGRMFPVPEGEDTGKSRIDRQAKAELVLWREVLAQELAAITMPVEWARAIADVTGGSQLQAAVSAAGSVPMLYAECFEAFRLARRGPAPHVSSYAAKHGISEDALLAYLATLSPAADHALRDAFSRWWQDVQSLNCLQRRDPDDEFDAESVQGFARAGLRVTVPGELP